MVDTGLILEGGGMRGLYTAGVLEYFMEQNLYFPYNIGVSASAYMAASYDYRQKRRNRIVYIGYIEDKRYISFTSFIKKREVFGMDFICDEIPNQLVPFDMETFRKNAEELVIVTTDCETGKPVYYDKANHGDDLVLLLSASSSLTFVSSSRAYRGRHLTYDCIVDS